MQSYKIPIKVRRRQPQGARAHSSDYASVQEATPPIVDIMEPAEESPKETSQAQSEGLDKWRDRALRLEAEMDNFRKRQRRLADDRLAADREHLLRAFLDISDDLERALSATDTDAESLREGVRITLQSLSNMLEQEGVEPLEAAGAPFDPHLHEAVGTLPHQEAGSHPNTVVEVVRPGYRLDERLLRAARVIVAS